MNAPVPLRGEVWLVELDPVRGHEQAGTRPAVIVSEDRFNHGPTGLAVILPITSTQRNTPLHVRMAPPEGGLRHISHIKCEDIRSISTERLNRRWGTLSPRTMVAVSIAASSPSPPVQPGD
jgi:mRNA interferase MazF